MQSTSVHKFLDDKKLIFWFPLFLVIYEMATYLSNDMYLAALSAIKTDLQTSAHLVQLTLSTWFLGSASLQLLVGPLSDRYGRRPILFFGGIVFLISSVVCMISNSISTLLIARVFQGSAVCSVTVAGYASVHELFSEKQAIRILAWMSSITVLAPAFGPLVGAVILDFTNWRGLFACVALLALIGLCGLFKLMPETIQDGKQHPLHLKTLIKKYCHIIKTPGFTLTSLSFCCVFASLIAWLTASPLIIIESAHGSIYHFGLAQLSVFGCFIIGTIIVKKLIHKYDKSVLIKFGLGLVSFGALLCAISGILAPSKLILFTICISIFGLGAGSCFSPLQRTAVDASNGAMGATMALFFTSMGIFAIIGSSLVTVFHRMDFLALAVVILMMTLLALLLQLILYRLK